MINSLFRIEQDRNIDQEEIIETETEKEFEIREKIYVNKNKSPKALKNSFSDTIMPLNLFPETETQIMTFYGTINNCSVRVISDGRHLSIFRMYPLPNNSFSEILMKYIPLKYIVDLKKSSFGSEQNLFRIMYFTNNRLLDEIYLSNFKVQETMTWINNILEKPRKKALVILDKRPFEDDGSYFTSELYLTLKDCKIDAYWITNNTLTSIGINIFTYDYVITFGDESFNKYVNTIVELENKEDFLKCRHAIFPKEYTKSISSSLRQFSDNDVLFKMIYGEQKKIPLQSVEIKNNDFHKINYFVGSMAIGHAARSRNNINESCMFGSLSYLIGPIVNIFSHKNFVGTIIYHHGNTQETLGFYPEDDIIGIWLLKGSHFYAHNSMNNYAQFDEDKLHLVIVRNQIDYVHFLELIHNGDLLTSNQVTIIPVDTVEFYPSNCDVLTLDGNVKKYYLSIVKQSDMKISLTV